MINRSLDFPVKPDRKATGLSNRQLDRLSDQLTRLWTRIRADQTSPYFEHSLYYNRVAHRYCRRLRYTVLEDYYATKVEVIIKRELYRARRNTRIQGS